MARKVFCACGQALAVPDNYPKPVARCSACGGTVQIPPLPGAPAPTAPVQSPYGAPASPSSPYGAPAGTGSSPYGAPADSYGVPPKQTYGEPTYGQAPPRQVSNDSRVLYVILGLVGVATALFCGCGGILYFAFSGVDNGQAARPQPSPPVQIPAPNFPSPSPPPGFPSHIPLPPVTPSNVPLNWQTLKSNSGWYEIELPGSPRNQISTVDGAREHKIVVNTAGGDYTVRYCSSTDMARQPGANSAVDGMYRRAWKREHSGGQRNNPSGIGAEGQELMIADGGKAYRGKFLERNGRVYEICWNGNNGALDFGNWARFSGSFQFRQDFAGPAPPPAIAPTTVPVVPLPGTPLTPTPLPGTPLTPTPLPGTPAASALNEFAKKRIYIPIKSKRKAIEVLRKSMDNYKGNSRLAELNQKNIDSMTQEVERDIESAARVNNLTREQIDAILREGDEKNWF